MQKSATAPSQQKQPEWAWQWAQFQNEEEWLFLDWIAPNTLETFHGKEVLDCGCGGGQHIALVAKVARSVTGVDLNAIEAARKHAARFPNVALVEADLTTMDLQREFDVVYSIGVLHHTDNPDATFRNIARHCKPGGHVIVWVYSAEGNALNRFFLEPLKRAFFRFLPRPLLHALAHALTLFVYLPVYTLYLLPLPFLPFYEYFGNWRRLSYQRNLLNVFDKLNAPQTWFIPREQIGRWFSEDVFTDVHLSPYKGVSWRGSGTKRSND
jgi:SAM-dependent methyltransferase